MIVVDTSALMAILLNEADADTCAAALEGAGRLLISSGTVAEALIVAQRRGVGDEMEQLLSGLGFEVMAVTAADARRVAEAYQNWGKGLHPAGLNFGDCFAYALAKEQACPLLYVGNDFARTDIHSSLPA
jgi:ribonuclease VapC